MPVAKFTDRATQFIESVLRLEPRFAAFDCDGTLWSGDAGEGFFTWECQNGFIPEELARYEMARYAEYRQGKISEDEMDGEMVTMHAGMSEAELERATAEYFDAYIASGIFPEMQELISRLQENGCEIWAVSSTNEWVIRYAMQRYGIPAERIIAAAARAENGRVTSQLTRMPSGDGKARLIREIVKKDPDVAFGNSRWDIAMLNIARHAFAVNPNPDLEELAQKQGWTVYWPESVAK